MREFVIMTCANDDFILGLKALLKSILVTWKSDNVLKVIILDTGIAPENRSLIESKYFSSKENIDFEWGLIDFGGMTFPRLRNFTNLSTYARLFIAKNYSYDEIVYCDSDFVFFLDPLEIFEEAAKVPQLVCAVADTGMRELKNDCPWINSVDDGQKTQMIFNAGLMHWKMNNEKFKCLPDLCRELMHRMEVEPKCADQTFLNFIFKDEIHYLNPRFNQLDNVNSAFRSWDLDSNIHFVGHKKPLINRDSGFKGEICNIIFDSVLDGRKSSFQILMRQTYFPFWFVKVCFYRVFDRVRLEKYLLHRPSFSTMRRINSRISNEFH